MDDYLGGAEEAVKLQVDMHALFKRGGFLLRKWSPSVLELDLQLYYQIPTNTPKHTKTQYTKTLGIEWNASHGVNVTELPPVECMNV